MGHHPNVFFERWWLGLAGEKCVDRGQHLSAVPCLIDGLAQCRAAGHAVREPGGKLLHLAGGFAVAGVAGKILAGFGFVEQHLEVGTNHAVAVGFCGAGVAAGGRVFGDLAEDPGVRRGGAADHDGVAVLQAVDDYFEARLSAATLDPDPIEDATEAFPEGALACGD